MWSNKHTVLFFPHQTWRWLTEVSEHNHAEQLNNNYTVQTCFKDSSNLLPVSQNEYLEVSCKLSRAYLYSTPADPDKH